jgi:hypothetical protein
MERVPWCRSYVHVGNTWVSEVNARESRMDTVLWRGRSIGYSFKKIIFP